MRVSSPCFFLWMLYIMIQHSNISDLYSMSNSESMFRFSVSERLYVTYIFPEKNHVHLTSINSNFGNGIIGTSKCLMFMCRLCVKIWGSDKINRIWFIKSLKSNYLSQSVQRIVPTCWVSMKSELPRIIPLLFNEASYRIFENHKALASGKSSLSDMMENILFALLTFIHFHTIWH